MFTSPLWKGNIHVVKRPYPRDAAVMNDNEHITLASFQDPQAAEDFVKLVKDIVKKRESSSEKDYIYLLEFYTSSTLLASATTLYKRFAITANISKKDALAIGDKMMNTVNSRHNSSLGKPLIERVVVSRIEVMPVVE